MRKEVITKELIKSAQEGNLDALEKLLKETEKEIFANLFCLIKNDNEISDIVQEALLKIVKNIKNLKDSESYRTWANKIALREYYNCIRKNRKYKDKINNCDICEIDNEDKLEDKKTLPIDNCINCELARVLKNSICKLPVHYKEAIVMREINGMSYDEIAKQAKTSVGTIKSRISRARNRLKEYIKPYME